MSTDLKQAAVEQWTTDPCGSGHVRSPVGSAEYLTELLRARAAYAPWMETELDIEGASGLNVLDVGCGQGIDLVGYARTGAHPVGVDVTPRHVELARSHLAELGLPGEVVLGDAEALPFETESFDRVSSNGVLHHTPDLHAALREIRRVLRPGGIATVIVYNRRSLHYWLHLVAVHGVLRGGLVRERGMAGVLSANVEHSSIGARPLVRVYSQQQIAGALRACGFTDVDTTVRHFRADDTLPTRALARIAPRALGPRTLERIGRRAGWFIVARGCRPPRD